MKAFVQSDLTAPNDLSIKSYNSVIIIHSNKYMCLYTHHHIKCMGLVYFKIFSIRNDKEKNICKISACESETGWEKKKAS